MSGITGLGTTYNLPNYTGILYQLTPSDTPFFSAIGGLTGGGQSISTEFEWEGFDLRNPSQSTAVEGAVAPTAQERVRQNFTNMVQIQQETISVSYSKLAAVGQKAGSNNSLPNPVRNELDWQTEQMLKQMVRDVEWSFINGTYQKPTDNTTPRKTRGILQAITTNVVNASVIQFAGATATTSTNKISATAHGYTAGTEVYLSGQATTTTLPNGLYYVVSPTTNDFQVSATSGGSAIAIDATGTVNVGTAHTLDVNSIENLLQSVYDNGGITQMGTAALMVSSTQKRAISAAYANAYGKFFETSRTVGGVNFTTLETNFGTLNVMLNRFMPKNEVAVVSLEECTPVYLEVPNKGHFFAEPLALTGASDQVQLYGEVGLAYGNEKAHGLLSGLAV